MITCNHCNTEHKKEQKYCKNCGKRLKKRRWIIWLVLFIFIQVLYIPSRSIMVPITMDHERIIEVPEITVKEVTIVDTITKTECGLVDFEYVVRGGFVENRPAFVWPTMFLANLEDAWGEFHVNFSYINMEKFSYEEFGGRNLNEKLDQGLISHADADFYSPNYVFLLGPGESIEIKETQDKPNRSHSYWGIAEVRAPQIIDCKPVNTYVNKTLNQTFKEMVEKTRTVKIKTTGTLLEFFKITSYLQWFILTFLFFLIIILILKNKDKYFRNYVLRWSKK